MAHKQESYPASFPNH